MIRDREPRAHPEPVLRSWSRELPDIGQGASIAFDPTRVEDAVRAGYEAGFAAGRVDGHAAAHAAATEEAAAAHEADRRQAGSLLLSLRDELHRVKAAEAELRAEFEVAVVHAAVTLAAAILDRELAVADDPGRDAIRRAFAVAPTGPGPLLVHLHPIDVARLGDLDGLALGREVTVVADVSVEPGGCRATIGATDIDATVATALERARHALAPEAV